MIKRGLAGGTPEQIKAVGASFSYLWYPARDRFGLGFEHVPMVKKTWDDGALRFIASAHPKSYWLLGNEPDYPNNVGNTLSPADAAKCWHDTMMVVRNVDSSARFIVGGLYWTAGTQWFDSFRLSYRSFYGQFPDVTGWHVHAYATDPAKYTTEQWRGLLLQTKSWIERTTPGAELWITEFGCLVNPAIAKRIIVEQVPWLDTQPWITRYAWYTAWSSNLQGSLFIGAESTQKTELGKLYTTSTLLPWQPPAFMNGTRSYEDPTITVGCKHVLEFGSGQVAIRRFICQTSVALTHTWHYYDGDIEVSWQ